MARLVHWSKVVADLRISDNSAKRFRAHQNFGLVYCHVADDDWLLGKDPFKVKIKIPEEVRNKSFVLPPLPAESEQVVVDDDPNNTD
jgi:hypothetical protein